MKDLIAGFFIGVGSILPGISSGICCVVFGIYEKLIDSILGFFKDIRKNFKFLSLIFIGLLFGIIVFGNFLKFVFHEFYIPTCFCFMGFILGSIPSIIKEAEISSFSFSHILCFLLSLILSVYLIMLERNKDIAIFNTISFDYNYLIFVGILMSFGIVIPGISKTVILMLLGMYEIYLNAITTLDFAILLPIFAGIGLGSFILLFLLKFLFQCFKSYTYLAISGFALSSILIIYPGFSFNLVGFFSIALFFFCLYLGIKLNSFKSLNSL